MMKVVLNPVRRASLAIACLTVVSVAMWCLAQRAVAVTKWDSSGMRALENKWTSIANPEEGLGKANVKEVSDSLRELLEESLPLGAVKHLADSCDAIPAEATERSRFENAVLGHIVRKLAEDGDRTRLIFVLSTRCPSDVSETGLTVEGFLAYYVDEKKMADPVLILGEAFSKCRVPEVRRDLADIVRRAFSRSGIAGEDDAEFVKNAMGWYKANKESLGVNKRYVTNDLAPLHGPHPYRPPLTYAPLFVPKSSKTALPERPSNRRK